MKALTRFVCYLVLVAMVLTACAPAATAVTEPTKASIQEVTLVVWDVLASPGETAIIEKLQTDFLAAHPGVKIDRNAKSFDDMKATAKLGLSSPDGPDVAQINQGLSDMGALVKAGLLENLTPYAQKYGWDKKISGGLIARNSFSTDGKMFGQGNLYGVSPTSELVGVFYRKDKFEEYGLNIPKTFAEFEDILKTLKEKGETPIVAGGLGGLAATHFYAEILNVYLSDRAYLDDLIFARNDQSWDTEVQQKAAEKLQEWTENGYFTKGFEGTSYDDQGSLLENGDAVMMLAGSWWSSTLAASSISEKFGFFMLPPENEGAYKMTVGGTSPAYAIRANSTKKTLAAEYINWMISESSAKVWANNGTIPLTYVDPSTMPAGSLIADLLTAWNTINQKDEVGHYLDWATPTFWDTLTASLEELMAFKITPEEFTMKLETDYSAYLTSLK